mmetsp:Transcript_9414/g.28194  ORF Transcript_9414/g.28194 Transcript_9414/m.28194 type:complete len:293 (+) Transcript_9414:338-1216(+)
MGGPCATTTTPRSVVSAWPSSASQRRAVAEPALSPSPARSVLWLAWQSSGSGSLVMSSCTRGVSGEPSTRSCAEPPPTHTQSTSTYASRSTCTRPWKSPTSAFTTASVAARASAPQWRRRSVSQRRLRARRSRWAHAGQPSSSHSRPSWLPPTITTWHRGRARQMALKRLAHSRTDARSFSRPVSSTPLARTSTPRTPSVASSSFCSSPKSPAKMASPTSAGACAAYHSARSTLRCRSRGPSPTQYALSHWCRCRSPTHTHRTKPPPPSPTTRTVGAPAPSRSSSESSTSSL